MKLMTSKLLNKIRGCFFNKSNWYKNRSDQKKKIEWPKTTNEWITRWQESLEGIKDKITDLWDDRSIFRTYRDVILENPALEKNNEFFLFINRIYISHILTSLRTFDDTDLRSVSLYNLIDELIDHPTEISLEWYVNGFREKTKESGKEQFRRNWGENDLSVSKLKSHRNILQKRCKEIRNHVNNYIAHNNKQKPEMSLTINDIDETLDGVFEMVNLYHTLLFASSWGEPDLTRWEDIFAIPWKREEQE